MNFCDLQRFEENRPSCGRRSH